MRKHYLPHLFITLLFCLLSGVVMSFRNLNEMQSAKVMEMYVIFIGILLLNPLFLPEQNREIWALKKSKLTPMWRLYLVRLTEAIVLIAFIITGFEFVLWMQDSQFFVKELWRGAFCETIFLGSIGFFTSAVTNQAVLGYMLSVLYFALNTGGHNHLGQFALFQMSRGQYDFWIVMLIGSIFLITGGIGIRERREV